MAGSESSPFANEGAALRAREAALRRFENLEKTLPVDRDAGRALAGIGWLYDVLPRDARRRAVDPSGVRALHASLSVLRPDADR